MKNYIEYGTDGKPVAVGGIDDHRTDAEKAAEIAEEYLKQHSK